MVKVQLELVPVQAPDHRVNVKPELGVAFRVTDPRSANNPLQPAPELLQFVMGVTPPAEETVPPPATLTVSALVAGANGAKIAVMELTDAKPTVQLVDVIPVQTLALPLPADHPLNTSFAAGCAVNVTDAPLTNEAVQGSRERLQDMLPGKPPGVELDDTVLAIFEEPLIFTLNAVVVENVASALKSLSITTTHILPDVPAHPPPQPDNALFELGVAVSVTLVPVGNAALHAPELQLSPPGVLVTEPEPALTEKTKVAEVAPPPTAATAPTSLPPPPPPPQPAMPSATKVSNNLFKKVPTLLDSCRASSELFLRFSIFSIDLPTTKNEDEGAVFLFFEFIFGYGIRYHSSKKINARHKAKNRPR